MHALSVSLGQTHITDKCDQLPFQDDFQKNLSEICLTLNAKCHAHIKKIVEQDARSPHLIEAFEIEKFIDSIDSDLWKAVCLLTQPLSLRAVKKESSHAYHSQRSPLQSPARRVHSQHPWEAMSFHCNRRST